MFIYLDEDNQEIPSARGLNSRTVYIGFTAKYESFRDEFCEKFHTSR
jgi:hypothetical protein